MRSSSSFGKRAADAMRLARLSRVQRGWALLKAGRLDEARQVADAALADAPTDGQARFFDARLAWLEAEDPAAALPRIEAGLSPRPTLQKLLARRVPPPPPRVEPWCGRLPDRTDEAFRLIS